MFFVPMSALSCGFLDNAPDLGRHWSRSMNQILSVKELAAQLGVSVRTVEYLLKSGHLPQPLRAGRKRLWHLPDVIDHMKAVRDAESS